MKLHKPTNIAAIKQHLEHKLAKAERTLANLEALIEKGRLGPLTTYRLNRVCSEIERINEALKFYASQPPGSR